MCAKNDLLIFSSFLDIWENVEWPRFFGPPCILSIFQMHILPTRTAQISLEMHFCVEVHTKKAVAQISFNDLAAMLTVELLTLPTFGLHVFDSTCTF